MAGLTARTFCQRCKKEFKGKIKTYIYDYTMQPLISGTAPLFGEPAKVNSYVELYCPKCKNAMKRAFELENLDSDD